MKKTIFVYSGEGARSSESGSRLLQTSRRWNEIAEILKDRLSIDLEEIWAAHQNMHRCPHSPLITVAAGICLADIWESWGYQPDIVLGHSIGELAAAYQAGMYNLEEILLVTYEIGRAAQNLEGTMLHGFQNEVEIENLEVCLSSKNFLSGDRTHVTVSGSRSEMRGFLEKHADFTEMKPEHPWHHRDYQQFAAALSSPPSSRADRASFVSGVSGQFEQQLEEGHWRKWLAEPMDFLAAVQSVKDAIGSQEIEIIEIGFHPVLKHSFKGFDTYRYISSMYRGQDDVKWILNQRKKLDQTPFLDKLSTDIESFRPGLDFDVELAYQDFTSLVFVQFSALLEPYFPSLAPQDFYRYKSVRQLLDRFGETADHSEAAAQRSYRRNRVAIAAMSCRFPSSAQTLNQFWESLLAGQDEVQADPERGDFEAGFLDRLSSTFDHHYFNIPEAEAKTMDPQQILALELTEMLFKDAGLDPAALDKSRVGVYIGAWNEEYHGHKDSVFYPTGTNPSIIASRISYHYDLRGPSWVANTACSSSLLAVHYASKDIEAGRVDYAIAGGVNMILGNSFTHSMRDSGFLSKDQRCKTFDDSANGYVRAEGGGLILLVNKDLVENFYAEVLGSSINQNGGRTQVITAPHPDAQEELILAACSDAEVEPADIAYVECHGTGTKIGDPIEISALQNTVARNRNSPCYLGSVKSNMGHLESAAGIAGLIKAVLALNQGKIPANIHFKTPNTFIDFDSFKLQVVDKPTPIAHTSLAGVSSFGFGGANAHVIMAGADESARKSLSEIHPPFDRNRGIALQRYFSLDSSDEPRNSLPAGETQMNGVRELIRKTFAELTGVETIQADIALTDQGLDSLSATDFLSTLQKNLGIELDTDLLFDYPLFDSLALYLEGQSGIEVVKESSGGNGGQAELDTRVRTLLQELTNLTEIDPDIELTDQGLDSLSATQLISQLETELGIELGADILFDYPLYDQFVAEVERRLQKEPA